MKRLLITLAALLMMPALASSLAAQQGNEVNTVPFSRTPYQVGEHLTYHVSFSSFVDAAHVELLVADRGTFFTREGLQLRAHVETTGVVNAALYSINNDYTSYIDPQTGIPYRTQQVIREAGRASDTSSEYNQPVGTAAIPPKLRLGEFPGTYDLVSALYRLRALPLADGAKYYFNVRSDLDQYIAELRVTGRELIKTNVGSFNTIVTEVRVANNSEVNNYHIRIYFSDDERHVPVLITAHLRSGDIRVELAGTEFITPPQTPTATPTPTPTVTATPVKTPTGPPKAGEQPFPPELPFKAGEQLNFTVFLANQPQSVATASFQVRPRAKYFNRDGLLLTVKAQTLASLSRVFFANDQINSYVDPNTLLPFRTELNLIEGRRRTQQTLTIDQDRGNAVTDKGTSIEIPVGTHDYVSVLYALRLFNLTPSNNPSTSRQNAVTMLVNNRPLTLKITSLKRETIKLGTQQVAAIQLSLTTDDPQPDKYGLRLWVSDDRRHLPLRVTANTQLGPVRADLAIIPTTQQ
ncbi:MAG TPA: DUF3108 domain-containing protein [Pyrinomonadaceae bacterium]|nr:DUF3108 domain-containing protein [Pyrinomonadaceae bacterium]